MADPAQVDRYFEALAQRTTQGRIPSTREPLPLRSLAELLADVADEVTKGMAAEAEGTRLLVAVLVGRLGGDVTITGEEMMAANLDVVTEATEDTVRLHTT
jgi:hypothetical protein